MVLSDLEDAILESDTNLTYRDICDMPFYTFIIKLERAKERAEERDKKNNNSTGTSSVSKNSSYRDVQRDAMRGMPKGFNNFKAPNVKLPSGLM